eukprot:11450465-Alexandrium_andersonii.AAC.1
MPRGTGSELEGEVEQEGSRRAGSARGAEGAMLQGAIAPTLPRRRRLWAAGRGSRRGGLAEGGRPRAGPALSSIAAALKGETADGQPDPAEAPDPVEKGKEGHGSARGRPA